MRSDAQQPITTLACVSSFMSDRFGIASVSISSRSLDMTYGLNDSSILVRKGELVVFSQNIELRTINIHGDDAVVVRPERWDTRELHRGLCMFSFQLVPRQCFGKILRLMRFPFVHDCSAFGMHLVIEMTEGELAGSLGSEKQSLSLVLSQRACKMALPS